MTYKEAYKKCKTLDELKEMVKSDMLVAMFINSDRKQIIQESVTEALKEKGWEWIDYDKQ